MHRIIMAAAFGFRERIFSCIHSSNQLSHLSLFLKGRVKIQLGGVPARHFTKTNSLTSIKHDQHKHQKYKRPKITDSLKGWTSLSNAKNPVSILHECFRYVDNHTGGSNYSFKIEPEKNMFLCKLKLKWPSEREFSAVASSKKGAMREASTQALSALWKSRSISSTGFPILVKNAPIPSDPEIILTGEERQKLSDLQGHYEEIKSHIDLAKTVKATDYGFLENKTEENIDVIYNLPRDHPILANPKRRMNRSLSLEESVLRPRVQIPLPIDDYRAELIEAVEKHRVVLLRAETGSGKSTRYPQFIFDHYAAQGRGVDCNIVVTQPRRLSAMSLARHVAKERNEQLGDVVGYAVRLNNVTPRLPGGSILYCTAGKLLQSLILNPNLDGVSHICLDEVHERPFDTDLIMGMLQRVMQRNPNLHISMMSATLDPKDFKNYFGDDCYVFDAPGRAYPVQTHFLEDIPRELLQQPKEKTEYPMMARIIQMIANEPAGGVLVFLPGWKEIQGVNRILRDDKRFFVVLLHSNVNLSDQMKVHDNPPPGKRKIVLATNIAESSITIADIVYVVDFPYERLGRFSYEFHEVEHTLAPCPKSRLIQRRGRAGRCQPGHCYHLLSKQEFQELPEAPVPALLRMSLDYPILVSKALIRGDSVRSFFSELLTPPAKDRVEDGVKSLEDLGALDSEERLTPLGNRLLGFGLDPRPAKAMVLSAILRCQNIVSAFCATMESFPFNIFSYYSNGLSSKDVHSSSDHMVLVNLFHLWLELNGKRREWEHLADSSGISLAYHEGLTAHKYMTDILNRLHSARLLFEASPDALLSKELQKEELLKGILLNVHHSLGLVKKSHFAGPISKNKVKLSTLSGKLLIFSKESVFYKESANYPSPFVFHYPSVDTGAIVTSRCCSLMSPLSVLLFMPWQFQVTTPKKQSDSDEKVVVSFDQSIKIGMNKSDYEALCKLREAMWECVDYFICKEGTSERDTVGYAEINDFRDHLIEILEDVLHAHAPQKCATATEEETVEGTQIMDRIEGTSRRNRITDLFREEET